MHAIVYPRKESISQLFFQIYSIFMFLGLKYAEFVFRSNKPKLLKSSLWDTIFRKSEFYFKI